MYHIIFVSICILALICFLIMKKIQPEICREYLIYLIAVCILLFIVLKFQGCF